MGSNAHFAAMRAALRGLAQGRLTFSQPRSLSLRFAFTRSRACRPPGAMVRGAVNGRH